VFALTVEFRIKPEHAEAFAAAIVDNARASRETEPSCRQFDVCRDPADPQSFFLYELYDDVQAFEAHLQTPHFLQLNATTLDWVEHKAVCRYQRIDP
jgi:(4S)-4-hydroxy-5-phosphonooxypentane-2,3-dione isomerase